MTSALSVATYVVSVLISTAVAVYATSRRQTPGARAFAVSTFGQAFWTFGHLLENLSPTLEGKVFWDDLQFLGTAAWVLGFSRLAETYVGVARGRPRTLQAANAALIGVYLALVFTDRFHHLIRPTKKLTHETPFGELVYPFTVPTLVAGFLMIALFGAAIALLVRHFTSSPVFFRKQIAFILAGALLPLLGVTATILGVSLSADRDTTPQTFALGGLLAAWGLFRYGFLELVPVAREVVIESMTDTVFVVDARNRIVDANPAALTALGKSAVEVIGLSTVEVFASWPDLARKFEHVADARAELSVDVLGVRGDYDVTITPLRDGGGDVVGRVILTHDVTRLKAVERELAARNQELESANRDLDAFTHSVSHDLRAPLRTIEGFSDVLFRTQRGRLDEKGEEHLALILDGTKQMRQLFEDLLKFSRLGRQPVTRRDVDMAELVGAVLSNVAPEIERRAVAVSVSRLPPCVGDPALLKQVYSNLLENALKYSRDTTAPRIEIGAKEATGNVTYFVEDNGVGFDMKHSDRLFKVFQRLHDPEKFEGTGVGLAIVASIVKRHGGRVWVESAPGAGTTFFFTVGADGAADGTGSTYVS